MHRFGLCGRRPVIYGLWSMCRPRDGRRRGEDGRLRWPQSRDFSGKSRFASPGACHRPTRVPDFEVVPRPTHSGASTGSMATRSLVRVSSCSGPQDADFSILPRSFREFSRALCVPRACVELTIRSEYLIPDSYTILVPRPLISGLWLKGVSAREVRLCPARGLV